MDKNQAENIAYYMQGFFSQYQQCGYDVPKEIVIEKYVKNIVNNRNSSYVYDDKKIV